MNSTSYFCRRSAGQKEDHQKRKEHTPRVDCVSDSCKRRNHDSERCQRVPGPRSVHQGEGRDSCYPWIHRDGVL